MVGLTLDAFLILESFDTKQLNRAWPSILNFLNIPD
jgi:hypothetical protein